jgi:hypothetical protein
MGEVTRKFLERRNNNISTKQVVLSFANMYYFIHKGGQDSYLEIILDRERCILNGISAKGNMAGYILSGGGSREIREQTIKYPVCLISMPPVVYAAPQISAA